MHLPICLGSKYIQNIIFIMKPPIRYGPISSRCLVLAMLCVLTPLLPLKWQIIFLIDLSWNTSLYISHLKVKMSKTILKCVKKYFEHINEDKAHFAIFEFHTRSNVNEKEWVLEAWSKPVSNKLLHERNVFVSS